MERITEKPSKPLFDGTYRLTVDGYVIRAVRSGTLLAGLVMRPSLDYGKLVYRITVNGAPVTLRAYMVVREVWGVPMRDPGPFNEMRRKIDAHNKMIRAEHQSQRKEAKKQAVERPLCPYCKVRQLRDHLLAQTCGEEPCMAEHKSVAERARKARTKGGVGAAECRDKPAPPLVPINPMPCPWESKQLTHQPAPGYGWHTAEADPMSAGWSADGVWFAVCESEMRREEAA